MSYSEHRFESEDGLSLYYRSYGSGDDVVVCLPGLTRNSRDFEDLAEHLAANRQRPWRVICPDMRGRGRSDYDPKPSGYRPSVYVRDIWRLLDLLEVNRVVVIGTSLGGLLAMVMAHQRPDRLRGCVLNDVGPEFPPAAVARILEYVGRTPPVADWDAAVAEARKQYAPVFPGAPDDFWPRYVRRFWAENAEGRPAPDYDPAVGDAMRKAQSALKLARWLRRLGLKSLGGMPTDAWDAFDALTVPCLLVRGVLSDVLTDDIVERMRRRKPDLEVVDVPERGHAPLLDEPLVLAAIDRFLARLA
ncbi:MAG: alpha/beta hydrolase [Lysobacterales bacterium]|jgi:pimeloyl-ACP methyl ester carboxylesterase